MTVLVTGATGFLGRHLLGALDAARVPVAAIVRDRTSWPYRAGEVGEVALIEGDPCGDAWVGAARGTRTIVHAAAIVAHSRRSPEAMIRVNVEGTRQVVRNASRLGARVVLVSSSGTVGCFRRPDAMADEHSPYVAATIDRWPYYRSKLDAERTARRLANQLGVELVIVRLPALLGPGDHRRRSTAHVSRVLTGGVPFVPCGGISFADARDVATAIARIATTASPRAIYHLPGANLTLARFFQMVAEVAGVGVTRRRAPAWLVDGLSLVTRGLPVRGLPDSVVLEMANHHWGLTSLWSHDELGYASRPARQTLMDTVAWLRSHHPALAVSHSREAAAGGRQFREYAVLR